MATKSAVAKTWNLKRNYDYTLDSRYPGGDKPEPALPSWLGSTPVNGWVDLPGSAMSTAGVPTVNPYSKAASETVDTWNSFAFNHIALKLLGLGNGGHTNSACNAVVEGSLGSTPGWLERVVSSAQSAIELESAQTSGPIYTDGRPRSAHSYYTPFWIHKANRAFLFGQGAVWSGGGVTPDMFAYVDGASDWENTAGNYQIWGTLLGTQTQSTRAICKHFVTEDVYYTAQPGGSCHLYRWSISGTTPGSVTHTDLGATAGGVDLTYYASAVDHTRNRIVYWRGIGEFGSASTTAHVYDITAGTWSTITITGPAAATITNGGNYQAMQYSAVTDSFYTRLRAESGGAAYAISAGSLVATAISTTGGSGIEADVTGPMNRFVLTPELIPGSSIGGVFYMPTHTSLVRFLRLH